MDATMVSKYSTAASRRTERRRADVCEFLFGVVFGDGPYSTQVSSPLKAVCQHCGKTVKAVGLNDHVKAVHEKVKP